MPHSWYEFWSGIGNDIPIYALGILPLWWATYMHHRCHRCWRLGHIDPKHSHPACRRHHSQAHKLGIRATADPDDWFEET